MIDSIKAVHHYVHTLSPEAIIFWTAISGWIAAAFVNAFPSPKENDSRSYVIFFNFIQGLAANFPWRRNGNGRKST